MIRRPPRSPPLYSSAASDVYKRQPRCRAAQSRDMSTTRSSADRDVPTTLASVPALPSKAPITVAAVAGRLGVAPSTLRTWDRRYDLGPSERVAGAHRRYSDVDVARLLIMRRLTLEGVAPADAASIAC